MKVTFLPHPKEWASTRLRNEIPARELQRLGVGEGNDILIASKHGWPAFIADGFSKIVFDVCDDHFAGGYREHYLNWCKRADLVTCNSNAMFDRILEETGVRATVIADPYEQPRGEPKCRRPPLWFGHQSNFKTIEPHLGIEDLIVVTNFRSDRTICWTPTVMDKMYEKAGIVLLPAGKNPAKSANRAIDAIRRGLYPCTGEMPAYRELGLGTPFPITEMDWRLQDPEGTKKRIHDLQELVEFRFSPERIGKEWLKALQSL